MNVYQAYVPVNQIVARRSAELHQAQMCRICLSGRNLRDIYTLGDQDRQQAIEQHSTRYLASHELPRFICQDCEVVIVFFQTMVSKRERAEGLMQSYVFAGGAWPEPRQEMELSDDDDDEDTDSESDSEDEETVVEQQVYPVEKVEADSTTESVPDAVLRSRFFDREGNGRNDTFDVVLDSVIQRQLNGPSPPEDARPFDDIFDVLLARQQPRAEMEDNESDDDIELVNEYNLNPL